MTKLNQWLAVAAVAAALSCCGGKALAQGGGPGGGGGGGGRMGGMAGMDPTQIAQMLAERMREPLAVTNDAEWAAISPLLTKVVQLQIESAGGGIGRMFTAGRGGRGGRAGGAFGQPDPAGDELQKSLDDHAPIADVKAALAKVRDAKRAKQAEVAKAQGALKEVLSTRQEATLVNMGLLE